MSSPRQQRRDELARQRGFSGYSQQRRHGAHVTNRASLDALPADARLARADALDALAAARREGLDLTMAAARHGTTPEAVAWWTEGAVRRSGSRWAVSAGDRLYRPMYAVSGGDTVVLDVRGSRVASHLGGYHATVGHYLSTGDPSRLEDFAGVSVAGVELETDPDVIDELARRRAFDYESIYRHSDL